MLQATRIRAEHPPLFHFFSLSISLFSMRARPSKLSLNPGQLQCGQEECTVRLGRKERGGVGWVTVLIMYSLCAYNMCGIYVLYIRVYRTYYILKTWMHRSFSTVLTTLAHTIQHTHAHPYTTVLTYSSRNSVWVGCVCSASGKWQKLNGTRRLWSNSCVNVFKVSASTPRRWAQWVVAEGGWQGPVGKG